MTDRIHLAVVDRRNFILGAAAVAGLCALLPLTGSPADAAGWEEFLKKDIGDATPAEGKIKIDLPEIAENGNTVPYSVDVESPMTDADHVKSLYVYATGNPGPQIIAAHFTPLAGKATAKSRMRLAKTQEIVVVAEMSDGKFYMSKQMVKVTVGGCGG
jgi:sulfur-oxidizing protein SoxY